jgi:putative PEP-CTERM system histidine kinase
MFETTITSIASFLLVTLSVLILYKKRSASNLAFSLAVFLIALIEVADRLSLMMSDVPIVFRAAIFLKSLLPVTLLFFSLAYSRQRVSPLWGSLLLAAVFFPVSVITYPLGDFFYSPDVQAERILFLGQTGYWFYLGIMVYCVIALINIEAAFKSSSGTGRWKMKFEVAGISAIIAILIFYFSCGLLHRTINMNLMPVRSGILIIAAFLVGYSRFFRGNDVRVAVSRYVLYRSLTMLLIGLYLILLWLTGEGMKYFKMSFGRDLTILAAFAGGMAMFLILFSEQLRRKAKVYINKHFYAHKHDYRNEWLKFTGRLYSCKTVADVQNVILSTYRETFGLKGASLYLLDRDEGKYMFAASHSMTVGAPELKASEGLISYFMDRGRVLNPLDGEHVSTPEEAFFISQTGARLIVPLTGNVDIEGLVVFGKQLVRENFIYEDYDLMKSIAKQAALSIVNFSLSEELAEAREMAAMAKISSFVIHDLKNLASTLSVLLDNAEDYMGEPEFQKDMLKTIGNTGKKMKDLIQKLGTVPEKQALITEPVDLNALVRETVRELDRAGAGAEFVYKGSSAISVADVEEVRKVVLNLLLNAMDAADGSGVIRVETGSDGDMAYIRVEDKGCGIKKEFMKNHMFRPFRTTKRKGLGIGLYQCKQIIETHGGRIGVNSKVGEGSVFTVRLPAAMSTAQG